MKEEDEGEGEGEHPWINWINNRPSPLMPRKNEYAVQSAVYDGHSL